MKEPSPQSMDDLNKPLVSVVLPAYMAELHVLKAIRSVLDQTYANLELIACDDASLDQTAFVLKKAARQDSRITVLQNDKNRGVAYTRNRCLSCAKGAYIGFIDADDWWVEDKIEIQLNFMIRHRCKVSFGHFVDVDDMENKGDAPVRTCKPTATYRSVLMDNYVLYQTLMFERSLLPLFHFPDVFHEDFVLTLDLLKKGIEMKGIDHVLAYRLRRPNSLTADKRKSAIMRWRVYRKTQQLGLIASLGYFSVYAFFSAIRMGNRVMMQISRVAKKRLMGEKAKR